MKKTIFTVQYGTGKKIMSEYNSKTITKIVVLRIFNQFAKKSSKCAKNFVDVLFLTKKPNAMQKQFNSLIYLPVSPLFCGLEDLK
jgi:hypothetical protein